MGKNIAIHQLAKERMMECAGEETTLKQVSPKTHFSANILVMILSIT